mgnify:CR=1 FL=1
MNETLNNYIDKIKKNRFLLIIIIIISDIILEKAEKAVKEYGTPDAKAYEDYKELLKDEVRNGVFGNPDHRIFTKVLVL